MRKRVTLSRPITPDALTLPGVQLACKDVRPGRSLNDCRPAFDNVRRPFRRRFFRSSFFSFLASEHLGTLHLKLTVKAEGEGLAAALRVIVEIEPLK